MRCTLHQIPALQFANPLAKFRSIKLAEIIRQRVQWGVDFDYVRKLTALNIVSLAGMAAAPPFPANVSIAGAVQSSTTLNWTVPEGTTAENLAGYKIYWRLTTDAQWTSSRYAGKVATHTLDNIVIDNYFFGVASVSKDGYESPVVFPGVNGSFGE
jgi:hypothetical protein